MVAVPGIPGNGYLEYPLKSNYKIQCTSIIIEQSCSILGTLIPAQTPRPIHIRLL